jgi:hypothetical protein
MRMLTAISLVLTASSAFASADLIAELASRANREGPEGVNAYLSTHWEGAMLQLARRTASCEVPAVKLSVELHRGTNAEATQAHGESLREAVGRCPATVLRFANEHEVPSFCGLPESVPDSRIQAETAKRVTKLRSNSSLAASTKGKTCISAYQEALRRATLGPWQTDQHIGRPTR